MNWLLNLFTGIPQAAATYFTRKMELREERLTQEREFTKALHLRKLELISQGLTADMNWEMEFARQAATSWKDEYTLLVVSIPLVMAFIPGLDVFVKAGFESFSSTPLWYQVMVQALFYATYGMRFFRRTQSDT